MGRNGTREAAEMGAFMRRVCRAMVRRSGDGELDALVELVKTKRVLDAAIVEAGQAAHRFGYSHADIAAELGITRQAAQKRFGTEDDE